MTPQDQIRADIKSALESAGYPADDPKHLNLEKPKQDRFGDISSPVAMVLAKKTGEPPRKIAENIMRRLPQGSKVIERIEIAGPGFLNFHLTRESLHFMVAEILKLGPKFGHSDNGGGEKVQLEFVSANPTGPLNVVSARAAAVGDVLANLFKACGFSVETEFYVNDAGRQVMLLGRSLSARYMTEIGRSEPLPEEGYHGEYLRQLALKLISEQKQNYAALSQEQRVEQFSRIALKHMIERQKKSLEQYGLVFDRWFRESALRERGAHQRVIDRLQEKGFLYQKDGALWFRSTEFGDDQDRVLITREGEPTYFAIDIAYHQDKYERGFHRLYDFWGPDHHGYIPRMRAALLALGHPGESFHVSIIQQVNLLRGGELVKMSKRAGEIVEMDELIEEVGVDAARYFFIDRRLSQPLDFDIDLAIKQSDENPVYYVQYAHARICNILEFAREKGVQPPEQVPMAALVEAHELNLIKKLIEFPEVIAKSAQFLEPHRITAYLHEVATLLHRFYHDHRVVTEDVELSHARILLVRATQQVLANGLSILNISAPRNM